MSFCIAGYGETKVLWNLQSLLGIKLENIGDGYAIVYTDFARYVGPIVSALHDNSTDAVGYYGAMSDKEKEESHEYWHDGSCSHKGIWPWDQQKEHTTSCVTLFTTRFFFLGTRVSQSWSRWSACICMLLY